MLQLNQTPKLEFSGSADEQALARQVWNLMRVQGYALSVRSPIRQSLDNLTQYFTEQKYQGLSDSEKIKPLIEAALVANPSIFLRQETETETTTEVDGTEVTQTVKQIVFVTNKQGIAPPAEPVPLDHHSFKTRLFEGARAVVPPTEEELAARAAARAAAQAAMPTQQLPYAATNAPQIPAATKIDPIKEAKDARAARDVTRPTTRDEVAAALPVEEPVVAPEPAIVIEPAEQAPTPVVSQPVVAAPTTPPSAPSLPVNIEVAEGVQVDLSKPTDELLDNYGKYFETAVATALGEDFRFVNFAEDWFIEDITGRFNKNDFRKIRDYMNEVGGPVSDNDILFDVYKKRNTDGDYAATRFALDFRLHKEKKDFEFVGVNDDRVWTAPGLPQIGNTVRKASEVGTEYKYLEDPKLTDSSEVKLDDERRVWEHTLTYYEYENGVLPFDATAKQMFPEALMPDQKSLILRLEAPQLYVTYTAELRYPTNNRGGWISGLEGFFADNLIPGAVLVLKSTEISNHFIIEYKESEEQEQRILFYDDRRQKFMFRTIAFACQVRGSLLLTPDRFSKLDGQKRLDESDRKRTDYVLQTAFEYVGSREQDGSYYALLDDLYPIANIERPFSRAYLRNLLTHGNSVFRPDEGAADAFYYRPASGRR